MRQSTTLTLVLTSLWLLASCRTAMIDDPPTYSTEWAHRPSRELVPSILGRLMVLEKGLSPQYTSVRVCVGTPRGEIATAEFLTEVKLAYAMWLSATGPSASSLWKRLEFVPRYTCDRKDNTFASFVVVADPLRPVDNDRVFAIGTIRCDRGSCGTGSFVGGYGNSGVISFSEKPGIPKSMSQFTPEAPAACVLSGFSKWTSLKSDLLAISSLSADVLRTTIDRYDALVSSTSPTFEQLASFGQSLEAARLVASGDSEFIRITDAYSTSGKTSLSVSYEPRKAIFSVLLHEVGHQFGMSHADNPASDAVSGDQLTATQSADGRWKTSHAAMAYGEPYLYLTADDKSGILSASRAISGTL